MRPVLFIFHRSACITFLIAGRSKSGNHAYIASVVALLTRAASIRRVWRVLTDGLHRKNPSNQCFPTPAVEPPARRIRFANIRICIYVGAKPRTSWIQIHSASRFSWIGDSFCWDIYTMVFNCRLARQSCKVAKGMPKSRTARRSGGFKISCISNLTVVRLELIEKRDVEKGGDISGGCSTWGGVRHVGVGTYGRLPGGGYRGLHW